MKIKDATSCLYEFNVSKKLIDLLDSYVFYLEENVIYKFKICDIKISKVSKMDMLIILVCSPVSFKFYKMYSDDIELKLEDEGKTWFYDEVSVRNKRITEIRKRQMSLF